MASKRAWGDKSGSGGDPNILKLEDSTRIRLVDPTGKTEYKQHAIEHKDDSDNAVFVVCPDDGNCPLCRKPEGPGGEQYWNRYRRFATNVWDYATNSVKVLIGGPQIFDKFDDAAEVGYDPMASDWTIHKSGSKKQTTYNVIRGNEVPFTGEIGPDDLHDLDKYTQPESVEQILEQVEKQGYDYDAMETRQFTEDTALAYVFPYGKMKGSTVEQVLATDQQYAEYMYNSKKNQGAFGDPLFLALHTVLEARGEVEPLPELDRSAAPPSSSKGGSTVSTEQSTDMVEMTNGDSTVTVPAEQAAGLEAAGFEKVEPEPAEDGKVELNTPDGENTILVDADQVKGLEDIGFTPVETETTYQLVFPVKMEKDGTVVEAPDAATMEALEAGGFKAQAPAEPEPPEPEITYPVTMQKDGAEAEAPDEATKTALEAAGFEMAAAGTAAPPEPEPDPISDDHAVTVKIAGTTMAMKFGAVVKAAEGGTEVVITDDDAAQVELEKRLGGGQTTASAAEAQLHKDANSEANGGEPMESAEHADPDKPFNCDLCDKAYKTKGALTQHKNKEHKDAKPAESAAPSGGDGRDAKIEEVKALIDKVPDLMKDYDKLLSLFQEVAGKKAISDFNEDELDKLKVKLQGMVK